MRKSLMKQWAIISIGLCCGVLAAMKAVADIEQVPIEGIRNFSRSVGSETFAGNPVGFGGAPDLTAMQWLNREGYSTVISLLMPGESGADPEGARAMAAKAGLRYVELPFDSKNPAQDLVTRFLAVVGDQQSQPVYIHCNSATRAAALWMIGRVKVDGLDPEQARLEGSAIAEKPDVAMRFFDTYLSSVSN